MPARLRLALVSGLIILGVLVLVGATYQGVATALERRRYPHPGQLADVGGHQLHIHCTGEGAPTVVLEASGAAMSAAWGWVQPEVAKATRVCSYDRAGLGWSEAGDLPYDPGRVPEELRALLNTTKQPPPYVLVGDSLGASFVRRFAALYPAETAALVLITGARHIDHDAQFLTVAPWLARTGVLRATGILSDNWKGLPADSRPVVASFLSRPDHLTRSARELARWDDAVRIGDTAQVPPRLPVVRVTADLNKEQDARRVATAIVEIGKKARAR